MEKTYIQPNEFWNLIQNDLDLIKTLEVNDFVPNSVQFLIGLEANKEFEVRVEDFKKRLEPYQNIVFTQVVITLGNVKISVDSSLAKTPDSVIVEKESTEWVEFEKAFFARFNQ